MPTIKARVGSQNTVRVLSNASSPPSRLINLVDVNGDLKTQDGMILVWDLSSETFIMTSVIDSSSTTIEGIAYFNNTSESTLPTNGALIVSGGVGIGKNLKVGGDLYIQGKSEFIGIATFRGGTINLGDSNSDDINVGGEFISNLNPNDDNLYDLGIDGKRWRNGRFSGLVTSTNLYVSDTSTFAGDVSVVGSVSVTEGLYYDIEDFDGPNGVAYFNNSGKLTSANSSSTETLTTTNLILTTNASGLPRWSSVIDGGEF